MREERPTTTDDTPLDRAIDQVLREMMTEEPPAGLSAKVRWRLLRQHEAVADGARPVRDRRGWLVPVSSAVAVLLVGTLLWTLKPAGPSPGPERSDRSGGAPRSQPAAGGATSAVKSGDTAAAAALAGPEGAEGVATGRAAAAKAGAVGGILVRDRTKAVQVAAAGIVSADEWPDEAGPGTRSAGTIGAAVALGDKEEEAEDPRFPRLVVRPLPRPADVVVSPVETHAVTITEIVIKPIEVTPLDTSAAASAAGAATSDKDPKREERR